MLDINDPRAIAADHQTSRFARLEDNLALSVQSNDAGALEQHRDVRVDSMYLANADVPEESGRDRYAKNAIVRSAVAGHEQARIVTTRNGIDEPADGRGPHGSRIGDRHEHPIDTCRVEGHAIAHEVVAQEHGVDQSDRAVEARCTNAQDLFCLRYLAKRDTPTRHEARRHTRQRGLDHARKDIVDAGRNGNQRGVGPGPRYTATGAVTAKDNEGIDPLRAHLGDSTSSVRFTIARCSDGYGLYRHSQRRRLESSRRDAEGRLVDEQAADTGRVSTRRDPRHRFALCMLRELGGAQARTTHLSARQRIGDDANAAEARTRSLVQKGGLDRRRPCDASTAAAIVRRFEAADGSNPRNWQMVESNGGAIAPGRLDSILNGIERLGNRLPHPTLLFAYMGAGVLVLSALAAWGGLAATNPVDGARIEAVNLLSADGLRRILTSAVGNFVEFPPLGTVLVAMLGIGIAERSGLLDALLRRLVEAAPNALLTYFVVFAGVLSSLGADSGYVVLIPLAALLFKAAGRHPLAGIAAAFAAVSAGFSANLLVGPLDAILAGLSTTAVQLVDPSYEVDAAGNWWFIIVSTLLITVVAGFITDRVTEPRLTPADDPGVITPVERPDAQLERRGLRAAGFLTLAFLGLVLTAVVPESGILRHPETGSVLRSPFISGIVVIIAIWAAIAGIAYGMGARTYRSGTDVVQGMERTMETMAGYLVLMFFAAQFVAWFGWTHLGQILAILGAEGLKALDPGTAPLLIAFILLSAVINLFIGSASAKWAIMAPVFVPMLYLLGISPEATQMTYRIGDSISNIITPLMPYLAIVVAFAQQHDRRVGVGSLIAMMVPYSVALFLCWSALLVVWIVLDLPLGPGASISLPTP